MSKIIQIDAIELVLRVEAKAKGACELPPGSNAGPYVERVLLPTGAPKGSPWCMADASDSGRIALGKEWPLPVSASCQEVADFCQKRGVLVATPERGDLWFLWSDKFGRFAHAAFVLTVSSDRQHIEVQAGNTVRPNEPGDIRDGWLNWTRVEPIGEKDRFGRWADLLGAAP